MNKILMLCLACFCMWTNYATAQCTAVAPPYSEDFTSYIPTCWTEAQGRPNVSTILTGTTSSWIADGFGNVGATGAARMNIYSTDRDEWLISPSIDLGTGMTTYQLDFDVILTDFIGTGTDLMGADDTLAVFISTDNGATWSTNNILRLWDVNDQPSNTGDAIVINLAGYTGVVKFGFYAASSASNTDYNVYVDNFMVRIPPSCPAPAALTVANITTNSVDFGWTENGTATQWSVEYGPTGFTPSAGNMTASSNPTTVTGLAASTDYDFYVRAVCGPGDSSTWVGPFSTTTLCSPAVAPWTETFATTSLPNCWMDSGQDPFRFSTAPGFGASGTADYTTGGGTNYAWIDGSTPNTAPDTLMTPFIDAAALTTPHLCFALFSNNTNNASNNTISIEFYDGATWNTLATFQQNLGPDWAELSYDLSSFTISGPVQARFIVDMTAGTNAFYNDILLDDISLNNGGCAESCITPGQLTATNITATTADLGSASMGSSFELEYGIDGFTQGTGNIMVSSDNPATVSGLTQNTDYQFYIRNICGAGDTSIIAGPFDFTTLANCPAPSVLMASNVMATSLDFGWTENGTATSWQVEYDVDGFAQGAGNMMVVSANPTAITGLTADTDYDFYVRAICGPGDSSTWVGPFSAATPCAAITPTYSENFDTYVPTCWTEQTGKINTPLTGTSSSWVGSTFGNIPSTTAAEYNLYTSTAGQWIISPSIDLGTGNNYQVEFDVAATDYNAQGTAALFEATDTFAVVISTDNGVTWSTANILQIWEQGSEPSATGDNIIIDLSSYSGVVKIGFYAIASTSTASDFDISVDNFIVRIPPSCSAPSALMASNVMATSLDFGWTENGTATSWQVEYDVDGFAQGAGNMMVVSTNPTAITGLMSNTDYDFYVRAICGPGDSSTWVGPFSAATPCAVIMPTYTTNFATFLPACWSDSDDGTVATGPIGTNISDWDQDGTSAIFNLYSDNNSDWLISPEFDLSTGAWQLEIDANAADYTFSGPGSSFSGMGSDDSVQVVISTDNGATWTTIYTWDVNNSLTFAPATTTVSLTAYTSNAIFGIIASEGLVDDTEDYFAIINNFTITPFVAPPAPNLVITEIMYNSPESGTDSLEFIEIYNAEPTAVDLSGYSLTGVTHTFGAGTSIAAGGYYVVAINATAFNTVYGMPADAIWLSGSLSNGGETILLLDPNGATVDSVTYDDGGVWPTSPDGNGPSLVFCDTALDNADGANWFASTTSTGVTINGNVVMASPGAADMICTAVAAPFEDVTASAYIGLDSVYCGASINLSGQLVITNNTAVDAANVPYTITVDGFPVLTNTITLLVGNSSDTITVGPLPVTPGSYDIAAFTSYMADSLMTNDTIRTTVVVSNPTASITSNTNTSCNGTADGMSTAMGSNGVPGYNYMWSDGTMGATLMNAAAGTYTVVVTDTVGCVDSTTTVITEPTVLSTTTTATNVDCNANATGSIDLTVSGGIPTYTFVWSNGTTMEDASNLMAGTYGITITDANGCMTVDSATVTEPAALVVSTNQDSSGNATSIVTGGTTPYAYLWDDNNAQNTVTATGLQNGTYTVVVTDANNCQDSATINVVVIGVESLASVTSLNMFPNPTTANVFVQLDLVQTADVTVQVMTVTGQSVLTKVVGAMQSELIELPTANLATGVYLVQMNIGDEQVTRKLIITRN